MFQYLLKLAIRNLRRNWTYSFINTLGLVIGLSCVLVIGIWVKNELSYDRFEKNAARIYRLTVEVNNEASGIHSHFARSWQKWIGQMPGYFSSIESMARLSPMGKTAIKLNDVKFNSDNVFQSNPEVLKIFGIKVLDGDPGKCLSSPGKILLARSLVDKYFNGQDITGKTLSMAGVYDTAFFDYQVSGIFNDFPENSHFHPLALVSMDDPSAFQGWAYTYLLLRKGSSPNDILNHFSPFAEKYLTREERPVSTIHLQNLTRIHLYSHKDREIEQNGDIKLVLFFSIAGGVIFLLALINYVNMSLALIFRKKKSLVINKVFGARLLNIFSGFFMESLLMFFISAVVTLAIVRYLSHDLTDFIPVGYFKYNLLLILAFMLILTLISALVVSVPQLLAISRPFHQSQEFFPQKMNLVSIMRSKRTGIKRLLVISQFTASIVLIICAVYFTKQKNYLLDHRLGKNSGRILLLGNLNWQVKDRYFQFKDLAMQSPLIKSVTGTMQEPSTEFMDAMPFSMSGFPASKKDLELYVSPVDDNFFRFFKIGLVAGRNFSPYSRGTPKEEYILNESAVRYLGFKNPEDVIGRDFKPDFDVEGIFRGGVITGVVKDFCFSTLKYKIRPLVFFQKPIWYWNFMVKIDSSETEESIRYLKSVWNQVYPEYVFDYSFNDESYSHAYKKEISQAKLSNFFMILAMIIATLGLYGLTAITTEQRTREIGIRKVVGARSSDIVLLLNKDFTVWVASSVLLAIPIAWYLISRWNTNYAYHATLSWWVFFAAGAAALLASWLTISYKTVKASLKNPVEVLRQD